MIKWYLLCCCLEIFSMHTHIIYTTIQFIPMSFTRLACVRRFVDIWVDLKIIMDGTNALSLIPVFCIRLFCKYARFIPKIESVDSDWFSRAKHTKRTTTTISATQRNIRNVFGLLFKPGLDLPLSIYTKKKILSFCFVRASETSTHYNIYFFQFFHSVAVVFETNQSFKHYVDWCTYADAVHLCM